MIQFEFNLPHTVDISNPIEEEGPVKGFRILSIRIFNTDKIGVDIFIPAGIPDEDVYIEGLVTDIKQMLMSSVMEMAEQMNKEIMKNAAQNIVKDHSSKVQ